MTTVAQLIERLKEMNPEAELVVLEAYVSGYYTCTKYVDLDIDEYSNNFEVLSNVIRLGWDRG